MEAAAISLTILDLNILATAIKYTTNYIVLRTPEAKA
jgi:hypothetical protein